MLSINSPVHAAPFPLGQRRGNPDVASIAIDLTWAPKRAEVSSSALSRAYPSPPMSGSHPLPPKATPEAGGRGEAPSGYSTAPAQDVYRGAQTQPPSIDLRGPPIMTPSLPRPFPQEPPERMSYGYQRPDQPHRPLSYPAQGISGVSQQHSYLPPGGPAVGAAFPAPSRPLTAESAQIISPKSQRKTKGHVASACVPCKRAHLRCDAQRPCSRCLSNGKEDSCVDVQHKKRGRPRLRDDRDARFDPSRFPPHEPRRPLSSIFPSGGSTNSGYDDPHRRMQSHRVLKSQPSEPITPRFLERGSSSDANVYAPLSIATRSPEPVAFLDMKMDFAKVSPAFIDAVGAPNLLGRNLTDIIVPADRDKITTIRGQFLDEQARKEPNYLPPILATLDHIIHAVGFSTEEVNRFQLDRQEYLTFAGIDGHPRPYHLRFGLAKEGSIYFVVVLLTLPARYPYPSPSPRSRENPHAYLPQPTTPQTAYTQHTPPVSATFDPVRRYSEGMGSRAAIAPPTGQMAPSLGPRVAGGAPSYAASPSRSEYPGPSAYQIPRSELSSATRAPPAQPSFQLPPIRAPPSQGVASGEPRWAREERSGRVDIGGLIDKPDPPGRP